MTDEATIREGFNKIRECIDPACSGVVGELIDALERRLIVAETLVRVLENSSSGGGSLQPPVGNQSTAGVPGEGTEDDNHRHSRHWSLPARDGYPLGSSKWEGMRLRGEV